jgi:hypothetical protein
LILQDYLNLIMTLIIISLIVVIIILIIGVIITYWYAKRKLKEISWISAIKLNLIWFIINIIFQLLAPGYLGLIISFIINTLLGAFNVKWNYETKFFESFRFAIVVLVILFIIALVLMFILIIIVIGTLVSSGIIVFPNFF